MFATLRTQPVLAALAAILVSLALAATAAPAMAGGGPRITPPPGCQTNC